MRNWEMERWIGVAGALLVAGSALPALLGTVDLLLPWPLWTGLFAAVFSALLVLWGVESNKRVQQALYAVLVLLSWVVVLAAPEATLRGLSTVLVAVAATGVYIFRLLVNLIVVALNTTVGIIAVGMIVPDGLLRFGFAAFFLLLQLSLIFVFYMLRREQQLRSELAEAYIGRQTAETILSETARSAERLHIARELHDVLGHQLTLLNLKLEASKYERGAAATNKNLEEAQSVARCILGDVRATVSDLRTSQVSTLSDALRDLGENIPNLEVSVEVVGDLDIDEEQQIVLLRSVQEIVTNTIRHAGARELSIFVEGDSERIVLAAGDDGTGAAFVIPGNGLRGLTERFARVGGGIEFAGEQGFQVRAWMPAR